MALAGFQLQWEIGSSAFSAASKAIELIAAVAQDDVQPLAIIAVESIGSLMDVDGHLVGHAVDVLSDARSHRLGKLKIHLGLKAGVASQLLQSTPAVKAFLLVSVLRLGISATEIGEVLFEMLVQTKGADIPLVSSRQLAAFAESVEGYSLAMRERVLSYIPFVSSVVENAATYDVHYHSPRIFSPLPADLAAKLFLAVFEAIQDQETGQIELKGYSHVVWVVSVLGSLLPDKLRVIGLKGEDLTPVRPATKIVIRLDTSAPHVWQIEHWYDLDGVSSVIQVKNDTDLYPSKYSALFLPKNQIYSAYRLQFVPKGPDVLGTLSIALLRVIMAVGTVYHDSDKDSDMQSVSFGSLCSKDFKYDLDSGFIRLGWPEGSINMEKVHDYAEDLSQRVRGLDGTNHDLYTIFASWVANCSEDSGLSLLDSTPDYIIDILSHAETLVLRAMQDDFAEVNINVYSNLWSVAKLENDTFENDPIVWRLLCRDPRRRVGAFELLRASFKSLLGPGQSLPTAELPPLALSTRGQVAFCRGLLHETIEAPQTIAEAFEITVLPGQLRWRGMKHNFILELPEYPNFSTQPKFGQYNLQTQDSRGYPSLVSLRTSRPPSLRFSVKQAPDLKTIYLRCEPPGDRISQIWPALVRWALATRVRPSGSDAKEQQRLCIENGVIDLQWKSPEYDGIQTWENFPDNCRAIASFYGDPWTDMLRFGAFDAQHLNCLIQDEASIFDCVNTACDKYGKRWIIMANS